ncbi:MAG: NAD(P)/FAD-dependent oxidoreductase [Spirochaetales bacterium]|nr:NAD(P)/FAD-dependent oxidoreductase [Spirochaetales bacterium]
MRKTDFDCIIAGAGCAGATLAKKCAEAGLSVCMLERKADRDTGYPWEVAIEIPVFGRIGLKLPDDSLREESPDVSRYYSGDIKNHIEVPSSQDDGIFFRHRNINQYLLDFARGAGVSLRDRHMVNGALIEENAIVGIRGTRKALVGRKDFSLKARLLVDATGIVAILRRQTPDSFMIKRKLRKQDYAMAWQEVREVNGGQCSELEKHLDIRPGMLYTKIGKYHAYEVIHLRKNKTASLVFGTSIDSSGENAKALCERFIAEHPYFGRRVYGGGQFIPLRRAIDNMAGNGFLCIGDAACQVIPTMGSGVAASMHAADVAARVITEAFNREDVSLPELWDYNAKYHGKRGALLASYDIIRRFLQSLSFEEIDEIFKAGLLKNEDFVNTFSSKTIELDLPQILEDLGKLFGHFNLFAVGMRFFQALNDSKKAMNIYKRYPEIYNKEAFSRWVDETNRLFSHYRTFRKGEKEEFY